MAINVGTKFDNFIVVSTAKEAVTMWKVYHEMGAYALSQCDAFERNVMEACLEDEYNEMSHNQTVMGIGLYDYNQYLRSTRN